MTKKILFLSVLLSIGSAVRAQVVEPNDTTGIDTTLTAQNKKLARQKNKAGYGALGKFNYLYVRVATFFPASGFANPLPTGFPSSAHFSLTDDLHHSFRLGYESGKVRHFMELNLGVPTLKLAINSGIALQVFGEGKQQTENAIASTNGFYLVRLGLGPQLTFKPIKEVRIGAYYRAGIAVFYTNYQNEQRTTIAPEQVRVDRVEARFLNYAYNGDIGLDVSYNALSFGVCFSMLKATQSAGNATDVKTADDPNIYSSYTERNGQQEGNNSFLPIRPEATLNRLSFSIGFML